MPARRGRPEVNEPADLRRETHGFDLLTAEQLVQLESGAVALARLLGYDVKAHDTAGGPTGRGLLADPGAAGFGEAVPDDAFQQEEESGVRGTKALVLVDEVWLAAEQVDISKEAAWRMQKLAGPNRDPRLGGPGRGAGSSLLSFREACSLAEVPLNEFPFKGPRATKEYMLALLELDYNFLQHHLSWRVKSGVGDRSSVCRVHKSVCDALHLLVSYDQLNVKNSAGWSS